eukprot:TRINITY_DN10442_c0_g2_i1.p1 TRINITY_DN10442_c0_g2~~TRINITY_DN10442_c0_g2_i1.p1  ORF type:complete len:152 (+),score=41.08 TRINITY_DN10442_c0_g2_i1:126-581(+)
MSSDDSRKTHITETIRKFTETVQEGKDAVATLVKEVKLKSDEVGMLQEEVAVLTKRRNERRKRCTVLKAEIEKFRTQQTAQATQAKVIHSTIADLTQAKNRLSTNLHNALQTQLATYTETANIMHSKNTALLANITPETIFSRAVKEACAA